MGNGGRFLGAELEQFKQAVAREQETGEPLTIADSTLSAAMLMVASRLEDITVQLERINAALDSRETD